MNNIFMNSENSKTLNLIDYHSILQIKLTREKKINILFYEILVFIIHGKIKKFVQE